MVSTLTRIKLRYGTGVTSRTSFHVVWGRAKACTSFQMITWSPFYFILTKKFIKLMPLLIAHRSLYLVGLFIFCSNSSSNFPFGDSSPFDLKAAMHRSWYFLTLLSPVDILVAELALQAHFESLKWCVVHCATEFKSKNFANMNGAKIFDLTEVSLNYKFIKFLSNIQPKPLETAVCVEMHRSNLEWS